MDALGTQCTEADQNTLCAQLDVWMDRWINFIDLEEGV